MVRIIAVLLGIVLAQGACADEQVRFESARYPVTELQQRLAKERGEPLAPRAPTKLEAYLSKPEGSGPFAAVISLHGCSGLSHSLRITEARFLNALGYVSLVVDSFSTRGIIEACVSPVPDRRADAMGALAYLSKLPFVDPDRVALIGRSQGGIVALQVASSEPAGGYDIPAGLAYKAIVALYPFCAAALGALSLPALVMIGDADDWTPANNCERWMARRAGHGAPVKLIVYPEARHAFDMLGVGNGVEIFGHRLKYDPDAAKRATAEIAEFLAVAFAK